MTKASKIILVLAIFLNLFLGAWYVLNKDIFYDTDIARDFLIMDEIAQKKVVLLGPRADAEGLFHSPLWHYINFPIFTASHGNPIVVGWFWIFLTTFFILTSFLIAKKLFDAKIAWLYALFLSFYMVPYMKGYSHPYGVLFLMPVFFFMFSRYRVVKSFKNLILLLLTAGYMISFEIGSSPFLILSAVYILYHILKSKKYTHLLGFLILVIPLAPYIFFDLRHNFLESKAIVNYILGVRKPKKLSLPSLLGDRLNLLFVQGLNFFKYETARWNLIPSLALIYFIFTFVKNKKDKYRDYYLNFLFIYFGFYTISLLHGAAILPFYWLPLTPLVFLIFFSLVRKNNKKILYPLFALIFTYNFLYNLKTIKDSQTIIGQQHSSWRFHNNLAKNIFADAPQTFGYFIYAPDFYGYAEKYALRYSQLNSSKNAKAFSKQGVTYLVVEPPPKNRPSLSVDWWKNNKLRILSSPAKVISFTNGFRVEKYNLTEKETMVTADPELSTWLEFR